MKYYAVTEDPNELLHYGVKGMKWGQHLFGDDLRPKSAGYKRALGKLRKAASKKAASVKSAVKKSSVQLSMNRQRKQQDKYNRAMQKAQRRMELVENLRNVDQARVYERGIDREYHNAVKTAKAQNKLNRILDKQAVRYAQNETKMDKYLKQARQGKLKYGKLSDDQIQRITQRLNAEKNARQLNGAEKTWHQQKKEARRAGKLEGITKGTAAAMTEVAKAGTQYGINHLINRMKMRSKASQEGKNDRIKDRKRNKTTRRDTDRKIREEAYEARVRNSEQNLFSRALHLKTATDAEYLLDKKNKDEQKRLREADEQLKNRVYERIVLGGKGDSTEAIIKRLNDRDQYYEQVFGKKPTNYDQPNGSTNIIEAKDIINKGVRTAKNKMSGKIKSTRSRMNEYAYEPMITRIAGSYKITGDDSGSLNLSSPARKPRRKKKDNPLKG